MDFTELVQTRRSVHEYSDQSIDEATLQRIFKKATLAPSGYNLQPWEFVALREEESKEKLKEVAHNQEHVVEADTSVIVLGSTDLTRHSEAVFEDWLAKGYLPNDDVKESLINNVEKMNAMSKADKRTWTTRSTALAAMTLMFAAWDEGIASCPMEGFDSKALVETFDIPDEYEPVMLITLGYPAADTSDIENERKGRRPVDDVVHYESFDPSSETTLLAPSADN